MLGVSTWPGDAYSLIEIGMCGSPSWVSIARKSATCACTF